jgi:hypothetical protein
MPASQVVEAIAVLLLGLWILAVHLAQVELRERLDHLQWAVQQLLEQRPTQPLDRRGSQPD